MMEIWDVERLHLGSGVACRRTDADIETPDYWDSLDGPPPPFSNEYLPSQAEIRRACLEIQRTWTDAERRRRAGYAKGEKRFGTLPLVDLFMYADLKPQGT